MMPTVSKDPYDRIRYDEAFNQDAIYKKHKPLIEKLQCAKNVFPAAEIEPDNSTVATSDLNGNLKHLSQAIDRYAQDCLQHLNSTRRMALAEPAIYAVTEMCIMAGGAALTITTLGSGSMGGSFAGFAAIFDSLRLLRGTIQSGHNLLSWPNNPLAGLEEDFSKNKIYIPRVLWPSITKAFISARQNEFEREKHTNFIKFATGITTYKQKPTVSFKEGMSISEVKKELNYRIDHFFADYEIKEGAKFKSLIKINISKFIDLLTTDSASPAAAQTPRYLYLHGSGGIGKTHFVQTLSEWIEELIPESVGFEDLVITSADELEGNTERPGAFLRILRNQLMQNKRGSVIIIDEATWLNDASMISSAKRIFNGDRSKLATSYFGAGIEGAGLSLEMPPMLIFVASNDPINDVPLESRFDTIQYPAPNQQALIQYAVNVASKSRILIEKKVRIPKKDITDWIHNLDKKNWNFRYVAGNLEAFFYPKKL